MSPWEHFHHTADIGVRGIGNSLGQAFEQAALAMTAVILDPAGIDETEEISVTVTASDPELLLYEWLNVLIYEMAVRGMLFCRFEVEIVGETLTGRAWGEPTAPSRHRPTVEIKGATFTELQVRRTDAGTWLVQCVVDI